MPTQDRGLGMAFSPISGEKTIQDLPLLLQQLFGSSQVGSSRLPRPRTRGSRPFGGEDLYQTLLGDRPGLGEVIAPESPSIVESPVPGEDAPGGGGGAPEAPYGSPGMGPEAFGGPAGPEGSEMSYGSTPEFGTTNFGPTTDPFSMEDTGGFDDSQGADDYDISDLMGPDESGGTPPEVPFDIDQLMSQLNFY